MFRCLAVCVLSYHNIRKLFLFSLLFNVYLQNNFIWPQVHSGRLSDYCASGDEFTPWPICWLCIWQRRQSRLNSICRSLGFVNWVTFWATIYNKYGKKNASSLKGLFMVTAVYPFTIISSNTIRHLDPKKHGPTLRTRNCWINTNMSQPLSQPCCQQVGFVGCHESSVVVKFKLKKLMKWVLQWLRKFSFHLGKVWLCVEVILQKINIICKSGTMGYSSSTLLNK